MANLDKVLEVIMSKTSKELEEKLAELQAASVEAGVDIKTH
jgi:hypothetical protein